MAFCLASTWMPLMVPSLGRVLPGLETTGRGKPLTRARIERISSRVVAAVSLVFAIQSIPAMVQSVPEMRQPWSSIVVIIFFIALDWVVVASIVQRNVALSAATFAIIYLCAIATWPLLVDSARSIPDVPWLWWLCSVAPHWPCSHSRSLSPPFIRLLRLFAMASCTLVPQAVVPISPQQHATLFTRSFLVA